MADNAGSPIPVKVEEHSQSVILTYFQGDIGSMVDAHFSRALKTYKAKAKSKKSNKSVKSEKSNSCQWNAAPSTSYTETQFQPLAGHLGGVKEADAASVPFSPVGEPSSSWSSFPARQSGGLGFPPIGYSLSSDGLGVTGQQYATSLLNLLHNDRAEMGPSLASGSKLDLLQGWTAPTGFRDQVDPTGGFDPGRSLDKKHLYWY